MIQPSRSDGCTELDNMTKQFFTVKYKQEGLRLFEVIAAELDI